MLRVFLRILYSIELPYIFLIIIHINYIPKPKKCKVFLKKNLLYYQKAAAQMRIQLSRLGRGQTNNHPWNGVAVVITIKSWRLHLHLGEVNAIVVATPPLIGARPNVYLRDLGVDVAIRPLVPMAKCDDITTFDFR